MEKGIVELSGDGYFLGMEDVIFTPLHVDPINFINLSARYYRDKGRGVSLQDELITESAVAITSSKLLQKEGMATRLTYPLICLTHKGLTKIVALHFKQKWLKIDV